MKKLILYFFLLTFSTIGLLGCSVNSTNSMTGIYLRSINGSDIIIGDDNCPTTMGNKTGNENIFYDLKSGDKIEPYFIEFYVKVSIL